MPMISVIVPTFNRAHYLQGALETLAAQETDCRFSYEILVVDNASKDDTRTVVRRFAETSPVPVRYLYESKPGDAPPRNRGIRESHGQWLAFFDDDQFAPPRWLLSLLTAAQRHNCLVLGGPVHLDLKESVITKLSPACRSTLREMQPYRGDQPYVAGAAPGTGNLLVSRQVFDRVGLFAEDLKGGGSDWHLIQKARSEGISPWYAADAGIRHRVEPNRMTPEYFRWDATNGGVAQADTDYRQHGAAGLLMRCLLRASRSAGYLPGHLLSRIRKSVCGATQSSMICWRTTGYLRRCLTILAPDLFPQKQFHESTNFRTGRSVGVKS
ncbi:MAG: glycosyltransferase family A protein [Planctomycetaceae bacterium]